MARSTVHYADSETNTILKRLHNKLRPAGTPVERVEYIIELLLLRIFEAKIKQDEIFSPLRKLLPSKQADPAFFDAGCRLQRFGLWKVSRNKKEKCFC